MPLTLNSAYFLTFKLLDNVPRLFRRYHAETVQLIVDGTVKAHRGQVWLSFGGFCAFWDWKTGTKATIEDNRARDAEKYIAIWIRGQAM